MNSNNRTNPNEYRTKSAGARYRRRRKRRTTIVILLAVLITVWTLIILLFIALLGQNGAKEGDGKTSFLSGFFSLFKKEEETTGPFETTPGLTTPQVTTQEPASDTASDTSAAQTTEPAQTGMKYISLSAKTNGIYTGDLMLINSDNPFNFDENGKVQSQSKSVWEVKKAGQIYSYKTANVNIALRNDVITQLSSLMNYFEEKTGRNDIQLTSGYRTEAAQRELYDWYVENYGATQAASYCALPGNSEHHTGLAFDCNVYTADDKTYNLDALKLSENDSKTYYDWLCENAWRYGFIARYPANKTAKTGISYEPWHFRYVGKAHAYYMFSTGKCLEEYIAYIRAYTYNGEHLKIETDDGEAYEVYYIGVSAVQKPAVTGEDGAVITPEITELPDSTTLYVPADKPYEISGNNLDGFIITVKIK